MSVLTQGGLRPARWTAVHIEVSSVSIRTHPSPHTSPYTRNVREQKKAPPERWGQGKEGEQPSTLLPCETARMFAGSLQGGYWPSALAIAALALSHALCLRSDIAITSRRETPETSPRAAIPKHVRTQDPTCSRTPLPGDAPLARCKPRQGAGPSFERPHAERKRES